VGWESVSGESHTHKLMRASVMGLLDSFAWSDPLVAAEAKSRFDRHWEDPQALPAEYKVRGGIRGGIGGMGGIGGGTALAKGRG
jgi:hypothetical protein